MNNNREFLQFGDQIRLHTLNFSNLSITDTIWSNNPSNSISNPKLAFASNTTTFANRNNNNNNSIGDLKNIAGNDFGVKYSSNDYNGVEVKNYKDRIIVKDVSNGFKGKKKKNQNENGNDKVSATVVDKWFKSLPASEALPRNEAIGGYIFVCNNDTMEENLRRELFGLPPRYRDSVRAITPGLPLFLYNYSTHQLHGIFEAASFGGTNIDATAWEDKKCAGSSRFPAQVRVLTRKMCGPLEEDAFRPILHHYDGPKFRLELNVEEALRLLDMFAEKNA